MSEREPSSPVCYAEEMDARYAGYLTDAEVATLLESLRRDECGMRDKLAAALPRIRDERTHAALKAMLESREADLARFEALIASLPRG